MLKTIELTLSNAAKPDLPPVTLDALVTEEEFGLVVGPRIAEELQLQHIDLREVEEIGKNVRLLPYAGPLRITTAMGEVYGGAVVCTRGAIIGKYLAQELGIAPKAAFTSASPVNSATQTGSKHPQAASRILVRENAIDAATCAKICEHAALNPRYRAGLVNTRTKTTTEVDSYFDETVRDTFIVPLHGIMDELQIILHRMITEHVEPFFDQKIEWWEAPQLLSYKAGGLYKPHSDAARWVPTPGGKGRWERYLDRDISLLLYVNDDFRGGALSFPDLNVTIQPKSGMLVAFPSSEDYIHGAQATLEGERLALVTWLAAYGTLRVRERNPNTILMKDAVAAAG